MKTIVLALTVAFGISSAANAQFRSKKNTDPELFISAIYDQKSDTYKAVSLRVDMSVFGRAPIYLGVQGGKIKGVQFDPTTRAFVNSKDGEAYLAAISAGLSAMKGKLKVGVQAGEIMSGLQKTNSTTWQVSNDQFFVGPEIMLNAQIVKRVYLTVGASNQSFTKWDSNTLAARAGIAVGIGNRTRK